MTEVTSALAASKAVSACGFIISEGGFLNIQLRVIEIDLAGAERSAVADILVNIVNAEKPRVFAKRYEGCVDHIGAVVQLLMLHKPEAEGIGAGHNDFYPLHRVNIRQHRSGVNEILQQCYFIEKNVFVPLGRQLFQIPVQHSH